jgi:CRISPR-associated protein Csn2
MVNINFNMLDEPIPIQRPTGLVVEDRTIFGRLVYALHNYSPDSGDVKLFDDKFEPLGAQEVMLVTDIPGYEVNSASVLKQVHGDLAEQLRDTPQSMSVLEQSMADITSIIIRETLHFEPELEVGELTLLKLFKAMEIKIEADNRSIFQRVPDIIQVFKYIRKKKLLIFVNLATLLDDAQLDAVAEYAALQNVCMLLVDTCSYRAQGNLAKYVLDKDFVMLKPCEGRNYALL